MVSQMEHPQNIPIESKNMLFVNFVSIFLVWGFGVFGIDNSPKHLHGSWLLSCQLF